MSEQDNLYQAPKSEVLATPNDPVNLVLQKPQKLDIGFGWNWISEAFELFKMAPVTWIGMMILYLIIFIVMSLIPLAGNFLPSISAPVLMAGFILGCDAQRNNQDFTISHLFAGFKKNTEQLLLIGLFYLILIMVASIPILIAMGTVFFDILNNPETADINPELFNSADFILKIALGFLISLALYVPVMMSIWFSPALVCMHNLTAMEAMKLSFKGCMRNIMPFLWYGIVMFLLMIIAMIPVGLGLLIILPLMMCTLYTSYESIFINKE